MRTRWSIEPIGRFLGGNIRIEGVCTYQGKTVALTYWQHRLSITLSPLAEKTADGKRWMAVTAQVPFNCEIGIGKFIRQDEHEIILQSADAETVYLYSPTHPRTLDFEKLLQGETVEFTR